MFMLERLIVEKPSDPLQFLHELLKHGFHDIIRVFVLGPPISDRKLIGTGLAAKLQLVHLTPKNLTQVQNSELKDKIENSDEEKGKVDPQLWAKLIAYRIQKPDCSGRGWLLEGFPTTREEAFVLTKEGIFPTHVVILEDSGLAPPGYIDFRINSPEEREELSKFRSQKTLLADFFHEEKVKCFKPEKSVNDLIDKVIEFVRTKERDFFNYIPRVILLGPPGSGRKTQAALLEKKYSLVRVDFQEVLYQAAISETPEQKELNRYLSTDQPVPDELLARIAAERLLRNDCLTKGWVLHNFPFTVIQAKQLTDLLTGFQVNRAIFLLADFDICVRRKEHRRLDLASGHEYTLQRDWIPHSAKLIQRPENVKEEIKVAYRSFTKTSQPLSYFFSNNLAEDIVFFVSTDKGIKKTFETVESIILGPSIWKYPTICDRAQTFFKTE